MSYKKLTKNPLFWFVIFLLCLIPVLAFLQYKWLEELSRIELEQKKKDLVASSFQFLRDFNYEIFSMYSLLKIDEKAWRTRDGQTMARQYADWQKKAYNPGLLQGIYLFDLQPGTISRYDVTLKKFLQAEKNSTTMDQAIHACLTARQKYGINLFYSFDTLENPTLIIPATSDSLGEIKGYLLLELDKDFLIDKLFPDLVDSHFTVSDKREFILRIVRNQSSNQAIKGASPPLYVSAPSSFFNDQTSFDFTLPLVMLIPRSPLKEVKLHVSKHQFPFIIRSTVRVNRNKPNDSGPGVNQMMPFDKWALFLRALEDELDITPQLLDSVNILSHELSAYTIQVKHQSGSLELAVFYHQLRNFFISSGILILLGASLILLLVAYQKDKILTYKEKEFVATVTHELNTPLAVICSAGENLAKGIISDKQRLIEYGELIKNEGFRLNKMVESILLYSGMQASLLAGKKEPLPVKEALEQVLNRFTLQLENRGIHLHTELPGELPPLRINKELFLSVVENLISNAVKHGGQGGWIRFTARFKERNRNDNTRYNLLEIIIEDQGPGIPKHELSHIFEPFFRGKTARDNQIQGSGLGLSLVKKIVDACKGQITIMSQPDKGTICLLQWPYTSD
jgi:signal transduction histidine kinase